MKSFAVTLVIWAALFALVWYPFHELFAPPGDWIGALVVAFFAGLAIGGLRKARLERKDARIVARTKSGPVDGVRTAVVGTLEPVDAMLTAPLSGEPCVLYDYEMTHTPPRRSSDSTMPSPIVDRGGMAMAPVYIKSGVREVRLLAFPGIEGFDNAELPDDVAERARAYIARTTFQEHSVVGAFKEIGKLLDDRSGSLRRDYRNTDYDDLDKSHFQERRVPAGAKVCVIGLYSEKEKAILPQEDVGGVRLIRGTRDEALQDLRAGRIASIMMAAFLILISAPTTYVLLTIRENYNEEHGLPTAAGARVEAFHKAVAAGDASAVRSALRRVDVNEPNQAGIPALALAPNAEVAKVLLEAGANVEQRDKYGYTPVMLQARDGRVDVVRLLISREADISAPNRFQDTNALDIAIDNGQEAVAAVLREAGARPTRPRRSSRSRPGYCSAAPPSRPRTARACRSPRRTLRP